MAYLQQDWEHATEAFRQAVLSDSQNLSDDFFLAATYFQRGLAQAAMEPLERVVRSDVGLPDELMRKYVPGPIQLSISVTERVSALAPFNSLGATLMLAEVYQRVGRLSDAIGVIQRLAGLAPDDPMLRLSLADLLLEQGDYSSVVELTQGMRRRDPASTDARRLRDVAKAALAAPSQSRLSVDLPSASRFAADLATVESVLEERVNAPPTPVRAKPGAAPQDPLTGLPLPGPSYPLSFPWRPGQSPIVLEAAAEWLATPLEPHVLFVIADLLGVHRLAERISWGYGNAIIFEIATRLHAYAGGGVVFRTGADAFLVCIPNVATDEPPRRLEEIRATVSEPVEYPEASTTVDLRCTLGAAISGGGESASELFLLTLSQLEAAQMSGIPESFVASVSPAVGSPRPEVADQPADRRRQTETLRKALKSRQIPGRCAKHPDREARRFNVQYPGRPAKNVWLCVEDVEASVGMGAVIRSTS